MSTAVSVLAINGYGGIFVANVIAAVLFVGILQLVYVSNGIVKSVRMTEEYLNQLAEGNLNIEIDERLNKRDDENGCMRAYASTLDEQIRYFETDIEKEK